MASPIWNFKYADSLTVVGISLCTAIVCEAISWLLIYRTTSYKNLRSSIDKAAKKLETMKVDTNKISLKKSKTKKIDRVETSLKESSRDLSLFKFKSSGVVALVLFAVFGLLNSLFEGRVVAKLPFHPFGLVMKMSHRGLQGNDATDCSMAFLYFLCSISIRSNLQKFLGFAPPRGAAGAGGLFPMPDPKTNWVNLYVLFVKVVGVARFVWGILIWFFSCFCGIMAIIFEVVVGGGMWCFVEWIGYRENVLCCWILVHVMTFRCYEDFIHCTELGMVFFIWIVLAMVF